MTLAENILFAVLGTLLMVFAGFGCSSTGGGHPKLNVTGDMSTDEARNWIKLGAECLAMKPQDHGNIHTVQRPGSSFIYSWTLPDGTPQQVGPVAGIMHHKGGDSFMCHYINRDWVKLHELGWHLNKINRYEDYSEPPHPSDWCKIVSGFQRRPDAATLPIVVIGPDGEIR